MDIVLVLLALPFVLPLMFAIAALIRFADGGTVFYRHARIGRFGQAFDCLKFRTMASNADEILCAHLHAHPQARVEWEETRKLKDDPRIIPGIGTFLRRSSLDELPQLLNVLRGDMSLVGPRPVVLEELAHYGPVTSLYESVRPGMTGLWQVSGRNDTSYEERVRLDAEYVRTQSLGKDIAILFRTAQVVAKGDGAY